MCKLNFLKCICLFLIVSCNVLSIENISNDFKFRNDKFNDIFRLNFKYKPYVLNNITSEPTVFYNISAEDDLDNNYNVKELLYQKFKKRNILLEESNEEFLLSIDTLSFEEYTEDFIRVRDDNNNLIGFSDKDFFKFKIIARIKINNNFEVIRISKEHNTEPRESFVFSGKIAKSGINVNARKMIENTISKFSNHVYSILSSPLFEVCNFEATK